MNCASFSRLKIELSAYQLSAKFRNVIMSLLWLFVISAPIVTIQARAVNISNTWMLPEEGFPVFYRHFRDKVSWYEADAVCQFHHANLVTADTTSQYDAIRAYLKELDVTSNVWLGLSKTSENSKFTWSNYRALNGMGHWQDSIPLGNNPLCVVMDPSSDFLWKPMACGGPEVATFICELPIPDWATGPKGCLLSEIPSLTILYIPEQSAVELTSDCGLDGTKRIACKGNADREDILKQLTCTITPDDDFDDKSSKSSVQVTTQSVDDSKTTKSWIWTSNTIDVDYGIPTRHRRETEETLSPVSTKSTTATESIFVTDTKKPQSNLVKLISTVSNPSQHEKPLLSSTTTMVPQTKINSEPVMEESSTMDFNNQTESSSPTPTTEEVEFSGAINQGTMFDFIELSEPDQIDSNKNNESEEFLSTTENGDRIQPSLPPTVVKIKKEPKEEKHVKKNLSNKLKTGLNLTKEVEMLPIIHDTSLVLNRTHRKEVPPFTEDITATKIFKVPENEKPASVNLTLVLTAQVNDKDEKPKFKHLEITASVLKKPLSEDILVNHVPKKGLEVEKPEVQTEVTQNSSKTYDYDFQENQTNNSLTSEPEKLPNRQRRLTRPQSQRFYPYFFSRVLG